MNSRQPARWFAAPLLCSLLALGGCGGIQFEGRAFDMMGLGEKEPQTDKKMADRAPLIVPPAPNLPEPGPREQVSNPQNWPQDPETLEQQRIAAAKAKKEEYYERGNTKDIDEFEKLSDPLDRRPGLFGGDNVSDEWRGDSPQEGTGDSSIIPSN